MYAAVAGAALAALLPTSGGAHEATAACLAVGNNRDGRLEVFQVDRTGELRHRWQRESLQDWSTWAGLGGHFQPGAALAHDAMDRLCVFVVDQSTKTVEFNLQKTPNSPAWSNWFALGNQPVEDPVAVGQNADGSLEVFAVGAADHSLKHIWQKGADGDWSAWADMGGSLESGPVVARNKSGQLEVFGIDARNQSLLHRWQTSAGASTWSDWTVLAEHIQPGFAVAQNTDGCLEAFGVSSSDGQVGHAYQRDAEPAASWSAWDGLGARMKPTLAAGRNVDGRLELFTLSPSNGMIFHSFQLKPGSTNNWARWTDMSLAGGLSVQPGASVTADWARLSAIGAMTRACPATAIDVDGKLDVFALDEQRENVVNHRRQIAGNLTWADWSSLDRSTSQYILKAWRSDDGLLDNRVQAIAQTPDGYIWIGTRNGLCRFDGVHFAAVNLDQAPSRNGNSITALFVDNDGALWIGADGAGLARLSAGRMTHFGTSDGLCGDSITVLSPSEDHSFWIGTTAGLCRRHDGKFTAEIAKEGPLLGFIRSVLQDSEGHLWVATEKGLVLVRRKDGACSKTNVLADSSVTGIWQDVPGRLWIGSNHGLMFHRSGFYSYSRDFGLADRFVNVIRNDSQGDIWVGTDSGLERFQEGTFSEVLDQEEMPLGKINTLFEDREGILWVGSQNGLFRLTAKKLLVYARHQGLSHNNITSVVEDGSGNLWIGTAGGGVDERNGETVMAFSPDTGFPFDLVTSLCHTKDGSIWAGGDANEGLAQLKDGKVMRYGRNNGLAGGDVKVMHEDRSGDLWVGTDRGLSCWRAGGFCANRACQEMAGVAVRDICEDWEGNLWFGTERGLSRWRDGKLALFDRKNGLLDNVVTALYADEEHSLWVGTEKGGLSRFHGGRFTSYTARQGLLSDDILEIVEDDFGWLWMTSSKGVFRVQKKDLDAIDNRKSGAVSSIDYGRDDGMESVLCGAGKPGGWKTRDGELWFPTSAGLVAIDPRVNNVNRAPPPVFIEQLVVDGNPVPLTKAAGSPMKINARRGELEFHYTALSFQKPERLGFKYKLEGADPDWIDAQTRRVAYYNNLPPGFYVFRVMACNSDGVWNTDGPSLGLKLLPRLWQTWWFQALAGVALVGMVAAGARQITRAKMQRRLEALEKQHAIEKERMRIARDIHDDLGGSLTQIIYLGEMARRDLAKPGEAAAHVGKITDSARQTVRALDEIVWAVRPENDRLDHLTLYLWQYAEEFFRGTQVRCRVEAPPDLPHRFVSADLRHSIYLMVKEAFNNVLKHAGASEVRIRFNFDDSTLAIRIEDNGVGLPLRPNGSFGNGLENMRNRVEEFQGQFSVTSEIGRGTRVQFSIPMKHDHIH